MKYSNKWVIYFLVFLITMPAVSFFQSCRSPSYRNYRKVVKKKRIKHAKRYKGKYQRKLRKTTVPIHNKYILKNKRRTHLHY
jgi:hypothetical protein